MFKVKFAAFCILNAFRLNAIPYILKRNLSFRKKKFGERWRENRTRSQIFKIHIKRKTYFGKEKKKKSHITCYTIVKRCNCNPDKI